ncbi:MAG: hypothetical protein PF904_15625 [Kiritimatiellae bacterium]|jgi:hypothetical protein|nr:hypothetical protein [Kiritimatiellia bacterium]
MPTGPLHIESNMVYHIGVSYATDSEGNVTAKIWGQEGSGAIDLTTATPVGSVTFGINESVVTNGFTAGEFSFGKLRNNGEFPSTQNYDSFRIYNDTPLTFGALTVPASGTIILVN